MNLFAQLVFSALISIALSVTVLKMLSSPLLRILKKLCPNEESAFFWLAYAKTMMILAPLLMTFTVQWIFNSDGILENFRLVLITSLASLILGLFRLDKKIHIHTPDHTTIRGQS